MSNPGIKDFKSHLVTLKEWESKFNNGRPFNSDINKCFEQFDKDEINDCDKNAHSFVFSGQSNTPRTLMDSLLLISDADCFNRKVLTRDGNFLVFAHYYKDLNQSFITVYDLFSGTAKMNFVSFDVSVVHFEMIGNYLLTMKRSDDYDFYEVRLLKINYSDLDVKELKVMDMDADFFQEEILKDQMGGDKFAIHLHYYIMIGQIQDDEIVMDEIDVDDLNFGGIELRGERLIGDKLQGFSGVFPGSTTFCELNLETREDKHIDVPSFPYHDKLRVVVYFPNNYCWTKNRFYGVFNIKRNYSQLLSFDIETLKWVDVEIFSQKLMTIFIDENEFLTIHNGHNYLKPYSFYRVALRKPDTLINLTRLAAVREANIYGIDKYIDVSRKISINL